MKYKEKLKELTIKYDAVRKLNQEIISISSDIFDDFISEIFNKYPIESFGWTQYTPYFNDGETCIFSANTDYLKINGEYAEESDWISPTKIISWGDWNSVTRKYENRVEEPNESYNSILSECYDEITGFLSNFDNQFYLEKFGDHAEITVTKEGFTIEDCDHD